MNLMQQLFIIDSKHLILQEGSIGLLALFLVLLVILFIILLLILIIRILVVTLRLLLGCHVCGRVEFLLDALAL